MNYQGLLQILPFKTEGTKNTVMLAISLPGEMQEQAKKARRA